MNASDHGSAAADPFTGLRHRNESRILRLLRREGPLSVTAVAEQLTLDKAVTGDVLATLLEQDLVGCDGGRSSRRYRINPQFAYSIGINVGRRSLDSLLIDFSGSVLRRINHGYDYPDPNDVFPRVERAVSALRAELDSGQLEHLVGIGVAAPHSLGGWFTEMHAPEDVFAQWNEIDISARIADELTQQVWFENDATAACMAEVAFGSGAGFGNGLYIFIGTFIGGGTVINGTVFAGAHDNAGAIGSLPVPLQYAWGPGRDEETRTTTQLINCASRYLLEDSLRSVAFDPDEVIHQLAGDTPEMLPDSVTDICDAWLRNAAISLAHAITAAVSVVDFEGVVIDASLPAVIIDRIVAQTDHALDDMDYQGLVRPQLVAGRLGAQARALGGAILPFYSCFAPARASLQGSVASAS